MDFNCLPEEVLELILSNLPTKKDLLRSRFVSNKWNRILTHLCWKRLVQLRDDWLELKNSEELFTTFTEEGKIPWSVSVFDDYNQPGGDKIERLKNIFWAIYGKSLLGARIHEKSSEVMLTFLQKMPNLTNLTIRAYETFKTTAEVLEEKIHLRSLRVLTLIQHRATKNLNLDLLDFLLNSTESRINELHLHNLALENIQSAQLFASLISNIPSIYISIEYLVSSASSVSSFLNIIDATGTPTQTQMGGCRNMLEHRDGLELTFEFGPQDNEKVQPESTHCSKGGDSKGQQTQDTALLPSVKFLQVSFRCTAAVLVPNVGFVGQFVNMSFLNSNKLSLDSVVIDTYKRQERPLRVGKILGLKNQFLGVTSLQLKQDYMLFLDAWIENFPNVKTLTVVETRADNLGVIFCGEWPLEHLTLYIRNWRVAEKALSSKMYEVEYHDPAVAPFKPKCRIPDPLSRLKELKILEIHVVTFGHYGSMQQILYEALMRMQPLELLLIENLQASEEYRTGLSKRHRIFQNPCCSGINA